jgi:hypothetical protein
MNLLWLQVRKGASLHHLPKMQRDDTVGPHYECTTVGGYSDHSDHYNGPATDCCTAARHQAST